jgi:hypothetical protein
MPGLCTFTLARFDRSRRPGLLGSVPLERLRLRRTPGLAWGRHLGTSDGSRTLGADLSRWAWFCCWDDDEAARRFHGGITSRLHPTEAATLTLRTIRTRGSWAGRRLAPPEPAAPEQPPTGTAGATNAAGAAGPAGTTGTGDVAGATNAAAATNAAGATSAARAANAARAAGATDAAGAAPATGAPDESGTAGAAGAAHAAGATDGSGAGSAAGDRPTPGHAERDADPPAGPLVVLTRARVRPQRWRPFTGAIPPVDGDLAAAAGRIRSLGVGEWPVLVQGTISVWEDVQAMTAFSRTEAHRRAVRRTAEEGWYSEELFARFGVVSTEGTWDGTPPLGCAPAPGR